MAARSARNIVNLKEPHFEHENARINKYTLADELPAQLSELGIRTMQQTHPSYTVKLITPQDKERVLKFLRRFFFRDEPLNLAVQLLETPDGRCLELEDYAASTLEDEVSLAAVDENGDYVGVMINGLVRREGRKGKGSTWRFDSLERLGHSNGLDNLSDITVTEICGNVESSPFTANNLYKEVDYTDKSESCPNEKFRRILKVLGHLDRSARIWDKLPESCNMVMEVRIASTHTAWRGRGLMRILCEESERLALLKGATAMRMDATSAFSAAAAERLKYQMVYSQVYSELEYAPKPEPPHLEARVYIKLLKDPSQQPEDTSNFTTI